MTKIRPMLAASKPVTPEDLNWAHGPFWVSPKLDGIRNLQIDSVSKSRKLLDLPNLHIQRTLARPELDGLDGELVVGSPTAPDCINASTSGVMSRGGEPDFTYFVFDLWDVPNIGYRQRKGAAARRVSELRDRGLPVAWVRQALCRNSSEVEAAIAENYESGYEGSIIRSFNGRYKYNRSTLGEQLLLKVKESVDAEMRVTDFIEMQHNNNEAQVNELGLTKRTTHKANKIGAGTLGKMKGIDLATGQPITVGPGKMTDEEKLHVWLNQDTYRGRISKYRYGKHGVLELPRFPRHIVWRSEIDL